jgi:hypothetical protein
MWMQLLKRACSLGVWESNVDRKPTQEDGQPEDDAAHATSGKQEGPGPKLMFEFTERSGHLLFQIVNKPTPLTNIDVVQVPEHALLAPGSVCSRHSPFSLRGLACTQGEMVLRNGIWTTDKTQHFVLQGLYFWNPGDLFLIANPVHSKQYLAPSFSSIASPHDASANELSVLSVVRRPSFKTSCSR